MNTLPKKITFTNKNTGKSLTFTKIKPIKLTPGTRVANTKPSKKYA